MVKIVTIGGGTGLFTLLSGLKKYPLDLSAIITMTDDGGSTGILRKEFKMLPPGDIRRAIVALSAADDKLKELFAYRFSKGSFSGHTFGNIFITALREITSSDQKAFQETARLLEVKGKIIPVTLEDRRLIARLVNGQIIKGETNIDIPKHNGNLRIKKLSLDEPAQANPQALKAIQQADFIIIGPGDLFTSIIPNFLPKGIVEAISRSKAKKIYICNLITKFGETNDFTAKDFLNTVEEYLGKNVLDYLVVNKKIAKKGMVRYKPADLQGFKGRIVEEDLISRSDFSRHDSKKLAKVIQKLANAKDAK